jgi:1-acyl-sn-glycerol-3-phosphate acyltransferase
MFVVLILIGIMIPFVAVFRKFNNIFRYWTSSMILFLSGIKTEIIGKPDNKTNIFIVNHKSMMDIMVLEMATGKKHNLSWVAKVELFKIKYFGLALSLTNMISLNREDRKGIIKLLKDVKDRVESKRTIAIFPEGTRYPKNDFLPFKSGAGIIANKLKLRVQPVVLVNTESFKNMKVIFLDSFDATKEKDWLQDSRTEMFKVFLENKNITK